MSKPPPARKTGEASRLDVEVVVEDERWRELGTVEAQVRNVAEALSAARRDLLDETSAATVLLADDAHVAKLNRTFRSKPVPTNVLSFPAGVAASSESGPLYIGDIILARETVEREAREQGIPVVHHIQHLTIHGLLHLLGFDHLTDDDANEMEAIETAILATIGVPDPYLPSLFEPMSK